MHDKLKKDLYYIHKFWVGLMDGDGSIQVNHWKFKSLQYRLVIKLKNCSENVTMLNIIAKTIGGSVRLVDRHKFVIWVLNNKKDIYKVIQIFKFYPPLTSRLRAQLAFMLDCFRKEDIIWYLNNRQYKYILYKINKPLEINKSYFNEWLSGFIEAEGCFSIRKVHNNHSFSIRQKNDKYILDSIKEHFNITNKIINKNNDFWSLEVYKKSVLIDIINHCTKFPLLGEKTLSFDKFKDLFL